MLKDLVYKSRSIRRFDANEKIPCASLKAWVDLARHSPSSANLQGIKFYLAHEQSETDKIFRWVKFGGYLKQWGGPAEGERPSAYIILMGDTRIKSQFDTDAGIAAQTIMLGAAEDGFGGCIVAAVQRAELAADLELPEYLPILLVLALGKPAEKVVLEDLPESGDIKYYRDAEGVHHVPKRLLEDLIVTCESLQANVTEADGPR